MVAFRLKSAPANVQSPRARIGCGGVPSFSAVVRAPRRACATGGSAGDKRRRWARPRGHAGVVDALLRRSPPAAEREFGRLKNDYALAPLRVRGLERVQLHADLTMLARLSVALARLEAQPFAVQPLAA